MLLLGVIVLVILIAISTGIGMRQFVQYKEYLFQKQVVIENTLVTTMQLRIQELGFLGEAIVRNKNLIKVVRSEDFQVKKRNVALKKYSMECLKILQTKI